MRTSYTILLITLSLLASAGALRFYKLGDWPFAGDETATLAEERSLFLEDKVDSDNPTYRLPRAIPLSYFFHHVSTTLFGSDEFGSRVVMALFGTFSVCLVFLMLNKLEGRPTAISTALLVALWPDHVFQSQQTRFYIVAAFFAYLCLFLGALIARYKSIPLSLMLCCSLFAAILCHSILVLLLPIIFCGLAARSCVDSQPMPRAVWLLFAGINVLLFIFGITYLMPLISGWNGNESWGYGIFHSSLASINMVGWPVALLSILGGGILIKEKTPQGWYWVSCALGWASASLILPLAVPYHPAYVFPFAIVVIVLAGYAIAAIYERLRPTSSLLAATWIILACLANIPSLASHYVDGSRTDMRTAAEYVQSNWQPGDRVTGFSMGLFSHYASGCKPTIPMHSDPSCVLELDTLVDGKGRVWIVVTSTRSGLPNYLIKWLGTRCSHELIVKRRRFDYAEYCVDVFLYTST